jgi:hypothetical protein
MHNDRRANELTILASGVIGLDEIGLVVGCLPVGATCQVQQFNIAELDGMTFTLKGDVAFLQQSAVFLDSRVKVVNVLAADLRFFVGEDRLALHPMLDPI